MEMMKELYNVDQPECPPDLAKFIGKSIFESKISHLDGDHVKFI